MLAAKSLGQLRLEDDAIVHTMPGQEEWRVRIADLKIVGEFLSQQRRGRGDYYVVFMTGDEWYKASFYAEGRGAVFEELSKRLQHELRGGLGDHTNYSSRVLWPAYLEGRPLFDILPEARASNIVTRVRQLLMQKVQMRFTEEVRKELGRPDA